MKSNKILMIGLNNSGKSTMITKLKDFNKEQEAEIFPTPFIDSSQLMIDGRKVIIIEIAGNLRYRDYWECFYNKVKGIIFVIDGTDISRLPIVKELIEKMFKLINPLLHIEVLINKSDLNDCVNKNSLLRFLELDNLDSKYSWNLSNSISFNSMGVKEAIKSIIIK